MREIKFRAWDGEKMHDARNGSNFYIELTAGGLLLALDHHNHGKTLELMQFTGLKDKNGREIYEGDIIEFPAKTEGVWPDQVGRQEVKFPFVCGNAWLGEVIGNIYENSELLK